MRAGTRSDYRVATSCRGTKPLPKGGTHHAFAPPGERWPHETASGTVNLVVPDLTDLDADGDPVCSDCAPLDPGRAVPVETIDLSIGPDEATVSWSSVPSASTYDLDRGLIAGAFVYDHACLGSGLAVPRFEDAEIPPLGQAFYYVARANNACGAGVLGIASRGSTLAKATCSAVEGS